ncbi:unnamed protein product [Sphagnum tenellum]
MSGKVTITPSFSLQDTKALCNSFERATNLSRAQFWLHKQQKFYQNISKQEQAWQTPAGVAYSVHRTVLPSSEGRALMELVVESSEAHVTRLQKGLVPDRTKTVAPPQLISSKSGFHPKVRQHSASGTKTILGHGTNAEQYY